MQTIAEYGDKTAVWLYTEVNGHLLDDAAPSVALNKLIRGPEFDGYPFSMLKKLEKTEQSPVHHPEGNVWRHTLLVVDEAAARKSESSDPRVLMWAALLHDIGKPATTRNRRGKITSYDHDKVGADMTRQFLSELTEDLPFIEKVAALVRYHMHILYVVNDLPYKDIIGMKRQTEIAEVALLGLCDRLGRSGANEAKEKAQIKRFVDLCQREQGGTMAKAGMRRPDPEAPHGEGHERNHFSKNEMKPVPELQGAAKFRKEKAKPILYKNADGSNRSV